MAQIVMVTLNDSSHTRTRYRGNLCTPDAVFCHRDLYRRCTWMVGADIGSDHLRMVTSVTMSGHRPSDQQGVFLTKEGQEDALNVPQADWTGFEAVCKAVLTAPPEVLTAERLNESFCSELLRCSVVHIPRGARGHPNPWDLDIELVDAVQDR